jgi:membrane protein implicated in regulation of membrane protease activity
MPRHLLTFTLVVALLTTAGPALAYFGPGAGITMLTALWGVILAVLLAVAAILAGPVRALLRRRRRGAEGEAAERNRAA